MILVSILIALLLGFSQQLEKMLDFMSLFFNPSESDDLFRRVDGEVDWQQEQITLYGKTHDLPRETAWYGDANNWSVSPSFRPNAFFKLR